MANSRFAQAGWLTAFCLILNSIYLLNFSDASMFYIANVLLHLFVGIVILFAGVVFIRNFLKSKKTTASFYINSFVFAIAAISGLTIIYIGNTHSTRFLLQTHIFSSFLCCFLAFFWLVRQQFFKDISRLAIYGLLFLFLTTTIASIWGGYWADAQFRITNEGLPPETLAGESQGGEAGPFFPSAAETKDGKLIPAQFFMDSKSCARAGCHVDIYEQWASSAHHFSSFNNQWYRKSIEYMQEVTDTIAPQWCGGCHDPALLFSGQMKQPVADFIDKPEAHAGLGCVACHSVSGVKNTMGNGGYIIEYPALHELMASNNKWIQMIHDFVLKIDPEPHKRTFLKPFHTVQTSEFCASCHKVHLDVPVNNYRWVRGFNTYDNWQASGVSGQGARSFYYPASPQDCASCHMPLTPSDDAGNRDGAVHSHRFIAANTALPVANQDTLQLELTKAFLENRQLTVDIFAAGTPTEINNEEAERPANSEQGANLASTFAIGEESGFSVGSGGITKAAAEIVAPLADGMTVFKRGESLRLDVVVRTRSIGHFFPSGTVDAQEAWLELQAIDDRGEIIFWSGAVADSGRGEVDPSAHFYRNLMLDAQGNPVNKRNAFASRSVLYVNLIPPGAADVAHYRLNIPENCGDEIRIIAKLNYRKFNWWHTQWAYAGVRDTTQTDLALSRDYDNGQWRFTGNLERVSGKLKEIPILPIVTMATDSLTLNVAGTSHSLATGTQHSVQKDREAWNDYGIGLLREGDLKGAERAFQKVTELEPNYADGWINLARVYLREGDLAEAKKSLDAAEIQQPGFHKTQFFRGLMHKANGEYEEALRQLHAAEAQYPSDRVIQNQLGRVYYLNSEPKTAITHFEKTLAIDQEDLMAHYNLMLCYRAAGDMEKSAAHEIRYRRYKEDESAKAIARAYRQAHPHDNNESQPIHEHQSGM